jgi:copper(I)-binding protein
VSSPRAVSVEMHEMSMDGDVMRMRAVEGVAIPAGGSVAFGPSGLHLMFTGVTAPFLEGEEIPVTLTFETAGAFEILLPVHAGAAHTAH